MTDKGKDLQQVLKALKDWGLKYIPGTSTKFAEDEQKLKGEMTNDNQLQK
jgi:DNA-binding HxlR family transcriptional regulator